MKGYQNQVAFFVLACTSKQLMIFRHLHEFD